MEIHCGLILSPTSSEKIQSCWLVLYHRSCDAIESTASNWHWLYHWMSEENAHPERWQLHIVWTHVHSLPYHQQRISSWATSQVHKTYWLLAQANHNDLKLKNGLLQTQQDITRATQRHQIQQIPKQDSSRMQECQTDHLGTSLVTKDNLPAHKAHRINPQTKTGRFWQLLHDQESLYCRRRH